jgi:serine/threonine-protein kinase RsbW
VDVRLTLSLPREVTSIPLARRVLARSLEVLGVTADCRSDIEIAVAEACTNVLKHVQAGDDYGVTVDVGDTVCTIEVVDAGGGFRPDELEDAGSDSDEGGRGITLMRALVDDVRFEQRPERGMAVRLEKQLAWEDNAPAARLIGPPG